MLINLKLKFLFERFDYMTLFSAEKKQYPQVQEALIELS